MNRSTGSSGQVPSRTAGVAGTWTGRNAQWRTRRCDRRRARVPRPAAMPSERSPARGHPIRTHAVRSSIAGWGSLVLGGILIVELYRIASMSGLSSGRPGTTTGPASVPFRTPSARVEPQARFLLPGP